MRCRFGDITHCNCKMKQQYLSIILLIIIISCSAFIPPKIAVSIHPHPNDRIVALAESTNELKAGELWKVERVDHISDWTEEVEIGIFPNPLSQKDHVPISWFVGLNDAVAANVQVS